MGSGATATPGFFGKLPAHGDFVERGGWSGAALGGWDDWLQRALAVSREQLGDGWLDAWLVSPLWRFALSPGCIDEQTWIGVIGPSVDRVGRYFPLVIAAPVAAPVALAATLLRRADWFLQIEEALLAALEQGLDADALLQRLPPVPVVPAAAAARGVCAGGEPASALAQLLDWQRQRDARACGLWQTRGSSAVAPCLLMSESMPDAGSFVALLDGDWVRWGWQVAIGG